MIRTSFALRGGLAAGLALATPSLVLAQSDAARVRVSINGGVQIGENAIKQSFSVQKDFEDTPISVDTGKRRDILFDGGAVVRLIGGFGVGAAVSMAQHDVDADITAQVPHPLYFRQPRTVAGGVKTTRQETAAHIQAVYVVPGRRFDVMIFGGPSLITVKQTLVTDITYSQSYPFDTATFTSASTTSPSKRVSGYHAGVDAAWKFSRNVGIGGVLRLTRARATLDAANNAGVTIDVGGLQAGGGLRLAF